MKKHMNNKNLHLEKPLTSECGGEETLEFNMTSILTNPTFKENLQAVKLQPESISRTQGNSIKALQSNPEPQLRKRSTRETFTVKTLPRARQHTEKWGSKKRPSVSNIAHKDQDQEQSSQSLFLFCVYLNHVATFLLISVVKDITEQQTTSMCLRSLSHVHYLDASASNHKRVQATEVLCIVYYLIKLKIVIT